MLILQFIIGFFSAIITLTLASEQGYWLQLAILGWFLYMCFYGTKIPYVLIFTFLVTNELQNSFHFGIYLLIGLILIGIYQLFGKQIHFTHRYVRYLIGLFLLTGAYNLLLSGGQNYVEYLYRLWPATIIIVITYFAQNFKKDRDLELI